MARPSLLAVIPARVGSKGLAGKNIRPFAGIPLIGHSIQMAQMCPEITRCILSTDSEEIAEVARGFGCEVPFLRPAELTEDTTPLWEVIRHALSSAEEDGPSYEFLLLLDPTSPSRFPSDITEAFGRLLRTPDAAGVIGVSRPDFDPLWHCVVEKDNWMSDLFEGADAIQRRQEVEAVYRINGSLYIWRAAYVREHSGSWRTGQHLMHQIPDFRAMSIDTLDEFDWAERLVLSGLIRFPWLNSNSQ